MRAASLKTTGYLVSTASVFLLGAAAWPGAAKEGLIPALVAGMFTSIFGMGCRWWSYRVERKEDKAEKAEIAQTARKQSA
jgi:hypothetical protein